MKMAMLFVLAIIANVFNIINKLKEFVDICGNDYGGDKIKALLD